MLPPTKSLVNNINYNLPISSSKISSCPVGKQLCAWYLFTAAPVLVVLGSQNPGCRIQIIFVWKVMTIRELNEFNIELKYYCSGISAIHYSWGNCYDFIISDLSENRV
jgi:hypothetical protein